jgi:hypothetical protein
MKSYTITVEEKEVSTRIVLGYEFAQLSTRTVLLVESETKPTLREIAAMLEPLVET